MLLYNCLGLGVSGEAVRVGGQIGKEGSLGCGIQTLVQAAL